MSATVERVETLRLAAERRRHEEAVRGKLISQLTAEEIDMRTAQLDAEDFISAGESRKAARQNLAKRKGQLEDAAQIEASRLTAELAEIEPLYAEARAEVIAAAEAFVIAKEKAVRLRLLYSSTWHQAHKLGLVDHRIEQGAFPSQLSTAWLKAIADGPW